MLSTTRPSMSTIGKVQDVDVNVRRQLAARHFYKLGKWVHYGGASLAVLLALLSPLVLLFWPSWGPTLGALAGAWIFVSRLFLEPLKLTMQLRGATAQEQFDCAVLGIDWNDALARRMPEEEIRKASGSMKGADKIRGWYPTDSDLPWPKSVLICQRSNAVWARRQHRVYARVLRGTALFWAVAGIVIAVLDDATLGQYLVTIALPSLPAVLDASEFARQHSTAAESRQIVEDRTDQLLKTAKIEEQQLREAQDQIFNLRRDAPLVPEWFYKVVRTNYEEDMRYAAERAADNGEAGDAGSTGST